MEAYLRDARNTFTSVACVRSQRKGTYVLRTMEGGLGGRAEDGVAGGGEGEPGRGQRLVG